MRTVLALSAVMLAAGSQWGFAQTCTGLECQQVSCPGGGTTTITGTVYAPNGTDPLPNVLVYIPNAAVDPFTPGVSCPLVGQPPSGSPLVGATTAVNGTFTITNVPVGSNIPLVIETGRWRRQFVIPTTTACTNTPVTGTRMPRNQTEGDIPKIAIATGSADEVECVLRKVGIDDTEFTDPSGSGRINLYSASNSPGAVIDASTPSANLLMGTAATLNSYDVLMLPCEAGAYNKPAGQLANLISFANAGGRVYTSHYGYEWMYQNPPFSGAAHWTGHSVSLSPDPGTATVDTTFSEGNTLSQWLQLIGATSVQGQMAISTLRQDTTGVIAPTQSWLKLNDAPDGNPVMQFVFDTPIGSTNQCGRVLFNEYHVENPLINIVGLSFPNECPATAMTPQEKLLEFSLFELTSDGSAATLTPNPLDFGSEPLGFTSPPQTFTWTNNSTFTSSVTLLTTTGDFSVTGNNCSSVASGASCQITAVFSPTILGARTGVLTVGSSGSTLTSTLTGTGIPGLSIAVTTLTFGNVDVGGSFSLPITLSNTAPGGIALPTFVGIGDFSGTSNCAAIIPANSTCTVNVIFSPTATGIRMGSLSIVSGAVSLPIALTGNGVDFSIIVTPTSGTVIAGYGVTTIVSMKPIAGFEAVVNLSCTTTASGSNCNVTSPTVLLAGTADVPIAITTTSKFTVVGYGGFGGGGMLCWIAMVSAWLVAMRRRRSGLARAGVLLLLLVAAAMSFTGCSGKYPATNSPYTAPGSATYTLSATDGIITHTATYTLNVTVK